MATWGKRPDSDYALALKLHDDGWTYRQIGERFGVGASRAWQMVERGYQLHRASSLTFASRSFASWDDRGWGGPRYSAGRPRYGAGDRAWQWRYWNGWVATPMIGRRDDNTAGWSDLSVPPPPNEHFARPPVDWVFPCPK